MSSDTKRTLVLLGALGLIAALFFLDRSTGGGDEVSADTGDRYLIEASLLADTRAVADARGQWESALDELRESWGQRRARMIAAPSAEIAAARLRTMIEQLLQDEGLALTTTETLPSVAAADDNKIVVVGLSLSFDARDAAPIFRVLDRVENMPGAASMIESAALRGPGRMGGSGQIAATIRVRAVANLTGENRG